MRILVTGSRDWPAPRFVEQRLERELFPATLAAGQSFTSEQVLVIVHGDCPRGVDRIADTWARARQAAGYLVLIEPHPANWQQYGRSAGFLRNQQMVDLGADLCLAFSYGDSKGTRDTLLRAGKAGITVELHRWEDHDL